MIRAEFDFTENGVKAKGYFSCLITSTENRSVKPIDCYIENLAFHCKGSPDFEKIKNMCWENSHIRLY